MPDWTKPMKQTYEYYTVDPATWKDEAPLNNVKSCTITRDSTVETLGSATIELNELVGECYVRAYLVTIQNGITDRYVLGTFLIQTPSTTFDGKVRGVSVDAYTPLIELKENPPPIGYSIFKGENIMQQAAMICREQLRAPVVAAECSETLYSDFVANTDDTWITFISDLISNAKYELDMDELGRILFCPQQKASALQPVYTYEDDGTSILQPKITMEHDIYGVPNAVEVIYSKNGEHYYAKVVNDDPNSPTSTVSRGREILSRVTDPEMGGTPTEDQIKLYAEETLKSVSSLEYSVSYTHGYNSTRVGECVRLNYSRAGLVDVKAKIVSQSIKCEPGCQVTEKAVFTVNTWR